MFIRTAETRNSEAIAAIILPTIREGATYTLDSEMSEDEALAYWLGPDKETFVAEENGVILGTYYMRPNQAGGGRHVCNCGYMTSSSAAGRGVAPSQPPSRLAFRWTASTRPIRRSTPTRSSLPRSTPWQTQRGDGLGRAMGFRRALSSSPIVKSLAAGRRDEVSGRRMPQPGTDQARPRQRQGESSHVVWLGLAGRKDWQFEASHPCRRLDIH